MCYTHLAVARRDTLNAFWEKWTEVVLICDISFIMAPVVLLSSRM